MESYRPDYVVHGETGYLVKSDSDLSQSLACLLNDQVLRFKMSAAAARHALQFDWDKVARDWENAFVEAVGKRRNKN
jgi:glycosyltransferase involved in cell wall biosynthesis